MDENVYPAEPVFAEQLAGRTDPWAWTRRRSWPSCKAEAGRRGLWNLFLPGEHGAGLTNLQYAPLAEITGRSLTWRPPRSTARRRTPATWRCWPQFGTEEQRKSWLQPLLDGEIRSAFAMTEPDVASSDATNISTRIVRDGDYYVINGRKWWISGAMNPDAEIFIVMGKTDPDAARHRQQSMILVPRDTPGVTIKRGMHVLRLRRPRARRPRRAGVPRRPRPGGQPDRRGGRRLRHRPGPARARAASTTACARSAWPSRRWS